MKISNKNFAESLYCVSCKTSFFILTNIHQTSPIECPIQPHTQYIFSNNAHSPHIHNISILLPFNIANQIRTVDTALTNFQQFAIRRLHRFHAITIDGQLGIVFVYRQYDFDRITFDVNYSDYLCKCKLSLHHTHFT